MQKKEMTKEVKAFLDLLKEERIKKKLSHQKLADKAGFNRSTIGLLENHLRNPTIMLSFKLAKALDVKLSDLIKKVEKRAK